MKNRSITESYFVRIVLAHVYNIHANESLRLQARFIHERETCSTTVFISQWAAASNKYNGESQKRDRYCGDFNDFIYKILINGPAAGRCLGIERSLLYTTVATLISASFRDSCALVQVIYSHKFTNSYACQKKKK